MPRQAPPERPTTPDRATGELAQRRGRGSLDQPKAAKKRPSGWLRWLGPAGRWLAMRGSRKKKELEKDHQRRMIQLQLFPKGSPPHTLKEWKELRSANVTRAKKLLEELKPIPAIHLLSRALLIDPEHAPYQSLLKKAIADRERRRDRRAANSLLDSGDPMLRDQLLELECFRSTITELETILDKAKVPKLQAPPPPKKG